MSPDIVLDLDADSNITGYYVGYIPEFPGAHSQGLTIEELRANLVEVVTMLREDYGSTTFLVVSYTSQILR